MRHLLDLSQSTVSTVLLCSMVDYTQRLQNITRRRLTAFHESARAPEPTTYISTFQQRLFAAKHCWIVGHHTDPVLADACMRRQNTLSAIACVVYQLPVESQPSHPVQTDATRSIWAECSREDLGIQGCKDGGPRASSAIESAASARYRIDKLTRLLFQIPHATRIKREMAICVAG